MATTESGGLSALGINPVYLLGQIVNFTLLLLLLKKFLYQPILVKLAERTKKIQTGLEAAEANIKRQSEIEQERQKILKQTQIEADRLIQKAKNEALNIQAEMMEKAKKDSQRVILKQQREFDEMIKKQEKALQAKVIDLASTMARKTLELFLDEARQKNILENQLKKLTNSKITVD